MIKLSASSIGTYEKCPKKYHYQYIEKPKVDRPEWIHLEFGSCAHRALELFHLDLLKNVREPSEYSAVMRESFKKALSEFNVELLRPELPYLREIIQDYLDLIKKEGLPPAISAEMGFEFLIEGFKVRGYIDRVDKLGPEEYEVVDYKTTKSPRYLTDFQLRLYALAVRERYPDAKLIHGSYVLLKHKSKSKRWTFSEQDLLDTFNHVVRVGTDIDVEETWEKKPTMLCNWCDFKSICQDSWIS